MPHVIVRYDFAGALLFPSDSQQNVDLQGIVLPSGPVSGFFEFDASTVPAAPGHFHLSSARFHGNFGGLTVNALGGQAVVGGAQDSMLTFSFTLPANEFPMPTVSAKASFGFQTFLNFYFSRFFLPAAEVTSGDRTTMVTFTDTHGHHGNLSTDTNVHFTAFHVKVV